MTNNSKKNCTVMIKIIGLEKYLIQRNTLNCPMSLSSHLIQNKILTTFYGIFFSRSSKKLTHLKTGVMNLNKSNLVDSRKAEVVFYFS